MFRLLFSCLVLGAALAVAKPPVPSEDDDSGVPPAQPRDLLPLTPSEGEASATYNLAHGTYNFTSPNFPRRYQDNLNLTFTVSGQQGQLVSIVCDFVRIQWSRRCVKDSLSINGRKYCGRRPISQISSPVLNMVFTTDGSVGRRGFSCMITVPEGSASTAGTTAGTTQAPPTDCCCGVPNRATRIVGGVQTEVNEYPWQAGLVSRGGTRTWCGGSIINNRYVLTAAHCTRGKSASQIQVLLREHRIGTSDGEIRAYISQIIEHPSYSSASGSGYDFALLRLSEALTFPSDNKIAPVCLPIAGNSYSNVEAIVSGWGTTSSGGSQANVLREVTVRTMTNSQCSSSYGSINQSMLCAGVSGGGKDSCQGDSGGPLVTLENDRYSLIGVVSWGRGCALAGYPGVYARVTEVLDWIQQNTADASVC